MQQTLSSIQASPARYEDTMPMEAPPRSRAVSQVRSRADRHDHRHHRRHSSRHSSRHKGVVQVLTCVHLVRGPLSPYRAQSQLSVLNCDGEPPGLRTPWTFQTVLMGGNHAGNILARATRTATVAASSTSFIHSPSRHVQGPNHRRQRFRTRPKPC